MNKLKHWLYAFAILIYSALLVAFAYDMEQGTSIPLSSTQAGRQEMLMPEDFSVLKSKTDPFINELERRRTDYDEKMEAVYEAD